MRALPEDEYYLSLRYRDLWRHLREEDNIHIEVEPDLPVPAAFCPWQQTLWVRPGISDMPLVAFMADVTTSLRTSNLETILHFTHTAPEEIQAITSPTALVVPGRSYGRPPRSLPMAMAG